MSPMIGPLRGRVILVLGGGQPEGEALALHVSALGAAVVVAGPVLDPVLRTAGSVAAAGGTVRVVETPVPPLPAGELVRLATEALEPPTDVVVVASCYPAPDAAHAAAEAIAAEAPDPATVRVWADVARGTEKASAARLAVELSRPSPG